MKNRVVWRSLAVVGACLPLVGAQHAAPPQSAMPGVALTPQDSALHTLNRLAYGPRPGDVPRVAAEGVMRWIDRQLSPDGIDDDRLAQRERRYDILRYDRGEDRKSTRLNSSHLVISYAVFCLKKKKKSEERVTASVCCTKSA